MASAKQLLDSVLVRPSAAGFMIALLLVYLILAVYQAPSPSQITTGNATVISTGGGNLSFNHPVVTIRPNVVKWGVDFGLWGYELNTSALTKTNYPTNLSGKGPILVVRKAPKLADSLKDTLQGVLKEVFQKNATQVSPQAFVRAVVLDTYWERLIALTGNTSYAKSIRFGVKFYNMTPVTYTFVPYGNATSYVMIVPRWEFYPLTPLSKAYPPYVYLTASYSLYTHFTGTQKVNGGHTSGVAWIAYSYTENNSAVTFWDNATYYIYTINKVPLGDVKYYLLLTVYRYWGNTKSEVLIIKEDGSPYTTISPATKDYYVITIPIYERGDPDKLELNPIGFHHTIEAIIYDKELFAGIDSKGKYTQYYITRNPFTARLVVGGKLTWSKKFLSISYNWYNVSTTTTTVVGNATSTFWGTGSIADEYHYYEPLPKVNLTETKYSNPIKDPTKFNAEVQQAYQYLNKYGARDLHALFGYAYVYSIWRVIEDKVAKTPASAFTIMDQVIESMSIHLNNSTIDNDPYFIVANKGGNVTYFAKVFYRFAFPVYDVSSNQFIVVLPQVKLSGEEANNTADYAMEELLQEAPYIKVSFWGKTPKNCISKFCSNLTYGREYYGFFMDYKVTFTNFTTYVNGTFINTSGYVLVNTGWAHYWRTIKYYGNNSSDYYWVPIAKLPKAGDNPPELPTNFHYPLQFSGGPVVTFYFDYNPVPYLGFQTPVKIAIEQYVGTPVFWQVITLANGTVSTITYATPR